MFGSPTCTNYNPALRRPGGIAQCGIHKHAPVTLPPMLTQRSRDFNAQDRCKRHCFSRLFSRFPHSTIAVIAGQHPLTRPLQRHAPRGQREPMPPLQVLRARLRHAGNAFIIANDYNMHRTFLARGRGIIRVEHIEFRTQAAGAGQGGSLYMNFSAQDDSQLIVDGAFLDAKAGWLLGNFSGRSRAKINNGRSFPTEYYPSGTARLEIQGPEANAHVWITMKDGDGGVLNLPDRTGSSSWQADREHGLDVDWSIKITNAPGVRLGLRSEPRSKLTVNGHGRPASGELAIGYFAGAGTETLSGLAVGLQNKTIGDRLTLNNVQMFPYGWQIYVNDNELLRIEESMVNEVVIFGNGHIEIEDSTLQFAVLGALGKGGTMDVRNSEIWSQSVEADHDVRITLTDCSIHGSLLHSRGPESAILIKGGRFHDNPGGAVNDNEFDPVTGQPRYNPYRPSGPPEAKGPGTVTCEGTANCSLQQSGCRE